MSKFKAISKKEEAFPKRASRLSGDSKTKFHWAKSTEINDPKRIGDWEWDLMIGLGQHSQIAAFVERKTSYAKLVKLPDKKTVSMNQATIQVLKNLPVCSITNDNGTESSAHENLSEKLKVLIYFTNPYSSWEKGTCENTIGLVRQFLPKKTDFNKIAKKGLQETEWLLNTRPKKKLNWQTPYEMFHNKKLHLTFESSESRASEAETSECGRNWSMKLKLSLEH